MLCLYCITDPSMQATWKDIESATKNLETSNTPTQVSKFELALIIITILRQNILLPDHG